VENTATRVNETDTGKSTDQIQHEMEQTRESITEKVAALETQVLDTFQTAADTVTSTVDAVKEAVTSTPSAVKEGVKQTVDAVKQTLHETVGSFSVSNCVRDRPWTAFGTSLLGGFLLGFRFGGGGRRSESNRYLAARAPAAEPILPAAAKPAEPGLFDALASKAIAGVRKMAEETLETALQSFNRSIKDHVPAVVDSAMQHMSEQVPFGTRVAQRSTSPSPDGRVAS